MINKINESTNQKIRWNSIFGVEISTNQQNQRIQRKIWGKVILQKHFFLIISVFYVSERFYWWPIGAHKLNLIFLICFKPYFTTQYFQRIQIRWNFSLNSLIFLIRWNFNDRWFVDFVSLIFVDSLNSLKNQRK